MRLIWKFFSNRGCGGRPAKIKKGEQGGSDPAVVEEVDFGRERNRPADLWRRHVTTNRSGVHSVLDSCAAGDESKPVGCVAR